MVGADGTLYRRDDQRLGAGYNATQRRRLIIGALEQTGRTGDAPAAGRVRHTSQTRRVVRTNAAVVRLQELRRKHLQKQFPDIITTGTKKAGVRKNKSADEQITSLILSGILRAPVHSSCMVPAIFAACLPAMS